MTDRFEREVSLQRRSLLAAGAALAVGGSFPVWSKPGQRQSAQDLPVKALVFDVIGTCADYWTAILQAGQALNQKKGLDIDWSQIAADWRALFPATFVAVSNGERPWESFTALRLEALEAVMRDRKITSVSQQELAEINTVWQWMAPWPDVLPGLRRLKSRFTLATLSNADMADMVKLAKRDGLPWDVILTSELAQVIKPNPKAYALAAQYLGLKPDEIMMVACHKADLAGAAAQGMRTAFISRPLEFGPGGKVDSQPDAKFDLNAASFLELAEKLEI